MSNTKFKRVRHRKPLSGYGSSFCKLFGGQKNLFKIDKHIARDFNMPIGHHRFLLPVIKKYKKARFKVIGLEQSTNSHNIYNYKFTDEPTLLVVGNECRGIYPDILECLDEVIEIPLFGEPHSLNVAVATSLCLFEHAKQIGQGK